MALTTVLNPSLTELLAEFEQQIGRLSQVDQDEFANLARKLCEWSRDIRFDLGPPDEAPRELVQSVIAAFDQAGAAIIERSAAGSELMQFAENIEHRASCIRSDVEELKLDRLKKTV